MPDILHDLLFKSFREGWPGIITGLMRKYKTSIALPEEAREFFMNTLQERHKTTCPDYISIAVYGSGPLVLLPDGRFSPEYSWELMINRDTPLGTGRLYYMGVWTGEILVTETALKPNSAINDTNR